MTFWMEVSSDKVRWEEAGHKRGRKEGRKRRRKEEDQKRGRKEGKAHLNLEREILGGY